MGLGPVEEIPHKWTWKPAASVNPLQDAQTAIALRDAELLTERDYLSALDIDPEAHWEEIAEQRKRKAINAPAPRLPAPVDPDEDDSEAENEESEEASD
jgi:hypothetical protein